MVTTWGNQFIASTSSAICAQRLYQNKGRHFRGVGGNKRVGSASWKRKNYAMMAKSFALPIKDLSSQFAWIKVRRCHLRGLSRLSVKYLLRGLFFPNGNDLRSSVLMVLQGQTQTEIRNPFGVAEDRLILGSQLCSALSNVIKDKITRRAAISVPKISFIKRFLCSS